MGLVPVGIVRLVRLVPVTEQKMQVQSVEVGRVLLVVQWFFVGLALFVLGWLVWSCVLGARAQVVSTR